jgi:hypothetical protein
MSRFHLKLLAVGACALVLLLALSFQTSNTVRAVGNGYCDADSEASGGGFTHYYTCETNGTYAATFQKYPGPGLVQSKMKQMADQSCINAGGTGVTTWDPGSPVIVVAHGYGYFNCQFSSPPPPLPPFLDIGLRVKEQGAATPTHIAIEPTGTSPLSALRIYKNGTVYGVALVLPTDPNATKMLIKVDGGSIRALRACTQVAANNCSYVP